MVYIFLADGFEDIEAVTPYDILKRGGVDVNFCSIYPDRYEVTAARGTRVVCEKKISEIGDAELLVMPGGLPGAHNLRDSSAVKEKIMSQYKNGKLIAAICAAPTVLGGWGLLKDKKATCYPSMKDELFAAEYYDGYAVKDKNIITGMGPGAAFDFGFLLLTEMKGKEVGDTVKSGMLL